MQKRHTHTLKKITFFQPPPPTPKGRYTTLPKYFHISAQTLLLCYSYCTHQNNKMKFMIFTVIFTFTITNQYYIIHLKELVQVLHQWCKTNNNPVWLPWTHTPSTAFQHRPPNCQILLRHWRGTLSLRAAVHRRGQRPPKGSGTNMTVEAT